MGYLRVKICGVKDEADAVQAAELGADAVGLNFYKSSPRYITPVKAESIVRALPTFVEAVAIFVSDGGPFTHFESIPKLGLRTIQFHGLDQDEVIPLLNSRMRLITAFSVGEKTDLVQITRLLKKCRQNRGDLPGSSGPSLAAWMKKPRPKPILPAAILVDARVPGQFGGTGQTAPWDLLADFKSDVPLILAGGLTPENVAEAVRIVRPYAVDVASGVESSPGHKDAEKMKRFIENAREATER
jgi:phosphoribosylanthranilate isomerase